jgi:hypothetical protein
MLSIHENVNIVCNDENVLCNEEVSLSMSASSKHKRCDNETSLKLQHYHLCHILRGRIERLIKADILHQLDFSNSNYCIDCIKGKYVEKIKKGAKRSMEILEIIYMDICCLFPTSMWMVMTHL